MNKYSTKKQGQLTKILIIVIANGKRVRNVVGIACHVLVKSNQDAVAKY